MSYYENARVQVVCCSAHRDHAKRDGCDSGNCLSEHGRTLDTERGKMVLFGRAGEYSVWLDLRQQQLVLFLAALGSLAQRLARQYYFSTKHDGSFGKMLTGWQWIYGAWYYFGTAADGREGVLFTNETTPDGYRVDKDGKWIGQANASGDSRAAVLAAWPGIYYLNEDTYIKVFDVSAGGTIHFGRRILDSSGEFPIYHEYTVPFTNAEMTEFQTPYQGGINEVFTLVDGGINATLEGGGRGADSGFYVKRR